jgi:DNA replication initiation complex subunit (GINS family)
MVRRDMDENQPARPEIEITDVDELKAQQDQSAEGVEDDEDPSVMEDDEEAEIQRVIEDHHGDGPGEIPEGDGDFVGYEDPSVMEDDLR